MSTQTQKTPIQLAEDFLKKYATVIGTLDAIKEQDRDFLLKYATVIGSKDAIDLVAPEDSGAPTGMDDQGPTGGTGSNDDQGGTDSNDDQDPTGGTDSNDAGAGEGTDTED